MIIIMMMSVPLAVELALRLRDGAARPARGPQVGARPAAESVESVVGPNGGAIIIIITAVIIIIIMMMMMIMGRTTPPRRPGPRRP